MLVGRASNRSILVNFVPEAGKAYNIYMSHYGDRKQLPWGALLPLFATDSALLSISCYTSELFRAARGRSNGARVDGLNNRGTSLAIGDGSYCRRS